MAEVAKALEDDNDDAGSGTSEDPDAATMEALAEALAREVSPPSPPREYLCPCISRSLTRPFCRDCPRSFACDANHEGGDPSRVVLFCG